MTNTGAIYYECLHEDCGYITTQGWRADRHQDNTGHDYRESWDE